MYTYYLYTTGSEFSYGTLALIDNRIRLVYPLLR